MIIAIAGFKGGCGKTTTAIHLAAYLNMQPPVLLIDGYAKEFRTNGLQSELMR